MTDVDQQQEETAPEAAAAAPEVTSPLIKLINALKGGAKKVNPEAAAESQKPAAADKKSAPKAPAPKTVAGKKQTDEPPAILPMPSGALVTVMTRNEFYRDGFRNLLRIAILEAVVIVGLILCFIFFMTTAESQDRYFATTADGRIMQLVPLDQANMNTAALMSWVAQSTADIMTFAYHDYQRRMQQSSRHFTRRGWESFTKALQDSRVLETVQSSKQIVSASPRSAPILVQQGVFNGKYRWIVKMSLQVSYTGSEGTRIDNLNLNLVIDRVPMLENPNGVGIEQWIAVQG